MPVQDSYGVPPEPPESPHLSESYAAMWKRAIDGDEHAFAAFYRRHNNTVFSHCMSRLDDRRDAEDLTIQVFELAWRRRSGVFFHAESDILPWLLVTSNYLLSHNRRSALRRYLAMQRVALPENVMDIADEIVDQDEEDKALTLAQEILAMLKPADREIIELVVIHEVSPRDLAAARHLPAGTVRARLSRALSRARQQYEALASDPATCPCEESK